MRLIPAQCRAARALLGWSQQDLERASRVAKKTIADFERGARNPFPRTLDDLIEALEKAGVEFTNQVTEVCGVGVRFKWGVEPDEINATQSATSGSGRTGGTLDALDQNDWDVEEPEDLEPFERTDEERAAMLAYWRARPEKWAALASTSRECLLRAMEVDRL